MTAKELKRLAQVLTPLPGADDATGEPPPRDSRFGLRLKLSGVHWVRPEVVVDVTYFTWTEDNLPVAGLASQGAAEGQAGNAGSADNSASASTQRGPSINESETGIGRCQRRWFGLIFPLPVVPAATQAAGENYHVAVGFALALCLYLAFMLRHPGTYRLGATTPPLRDDLGVHSTARLDWRWLAVGTDLGIQSARPSQEIAFSKLAPVRYRYLRAGAWCLSPRWRPAACAHAKAPAACGWRHVPTTKRRAHRETGRIRRVPTPELSSV